MIKNYNNSYTYILYIDVVYHVFPFHHLTTRETAYIEKLEVITSYNFVPPQFNHCQLVCLLLNISIYNYYYIITRTRI